ncbi:AGE family epimerase/isomerase [Halomonas smyrnensis]|uniref:AGE family epimerase/isomerase n=1 Tax=Halomonas smyrnensis TaxID=720605 RepID=UPI001ED9BFDC|nr:AGE family epimerase/isomerase [Halomonas smyrnensis]
MLKSDHRRWLEKTGLALLEFGAAAEHPAGGYGWLDTAGHLDPGRPVTTLQTARLTHVFSLAHRLGVPEAKGKVEHGLAGLRQLADDQYGGWYQGQQAPGATTHKHAYSHAFVALAASSAHQALGTAQTRALLDRAIDVIDTHFWSDDMGLCLESYDRDWTKLDAYLGANSNMHTLEAYLALCDTTGDVRWLDRALAIAETFIHHHARRHDYLVPEHFDSQMRVLYDFHKDQPADQFRPYGLTPGHSLEWSRLLLNLEASCLRHGRPTPSWLLEDAEGLFAAAARHGWEADGQPGFVYTLDWDKRPVITARRHWVTSEAVGAAHALLVRTGRQEYADWYATWWAYIDRHIIDHDQGGWLHELDEASRPRARYWPEGKPDIYHAFQATLLPLLPLAPTPSTALSRPPWAERLARHP